MDETTEKNDGMKYHEAILHEMESTRLDEDPIGAVRLVNLGMKIEVKFEHRQPIRDKIRETVDWMEALVDDSHHSRIGDCVTAAREWLALKNDETSADEQTSESTD